MRVAITKLGNTLVKEAARWHDFVANMSQESLKKLKDAGLVKSYAEYVNGINRGTNNILHRLGVIKVNAGIPTENDRRSIIHNLENSIRINRKKKGLMMLA